MLERKELAWLAPDSLAFQEKGPQQSASGEMLKLSNGMRANADDAGAVEFRREFMEERRALQLVVVLVTGKFIVIPLKFLTLHKTYTGMYPGGRVCKE